MVGDSGQRYGISDSGIALFATEPQRVESRIQQEHYDRVATTYVQNLDLPHTEAYSPYLDGVLLDSIAATACSITSGFADATEISPPMSSGGS